MLIGLRSKSLFKGEQGITTVWETVVRSARQELCSQSAVLCFNGTLLVRQLSILKVKAPSAKLVGGFG
ncbi:hypothetical protein [Psychrobacter vallis]|uniref:hypothetical protein n=1 Tax=Psychrobacter vallis TaxID=248451 RepID=UPI001917E6F0|nr:hypothetical protein [Psychrobacter vallis]